MYCSSCGTMNAPGRATCEACGARLASSVARAPAPGGGWAPPARQIPLCPRCAYEGTGATYFSRGSHVAALVGATVLTAGMMGAGGIVYYLMRKDHRVCPRCGMTWGRFGERAVVAPAGPDEALPVPPQGRERMKRGWSILLFLVTAFLAAVGVGIGEIGPIIFAMFAGAGAVALQLAANNDRDARRVALISSLQLPVLKLAADRGGRLTVTQVAAELGWPIRRAEKILESLDDGLRVDSEVTDEGVIVYEFRELLGREGGGETPRLAEG